MREVTGTRQPTLLQHGIQRLKRLCPVLGFGPDDERAIVDIFSRMASTWGRLRYGSKPRWPSDITDDSSPYEFSVAIDGTSPELRILVEPQGDAPGIQANWQAALNTNDLLARKYGASFTRFRTIQDLFAPTTSTGRFAAWHAVCFRPGSAPDFKIYLNPFVRGRANARAAVEEAMNRLGFGNASEHLPANDSDDISIYLSLDLATGAKARVKAYTGHFNATATRVEAALRAVQGYVPGQVAQFCRVMGGSDERYDARPVQTCLAFTEGNPVPTSGTVYFPVRCHADSDFEVSKRIVGYLRGESAAIYQRAIDAFTNRPLAEGVAMQTYVSLRQAIGPRRVTVYLSPELYNVERAGRAGLRSGVFSKRSKKVLVRAGGA